MHFPSSSLSILALVPSASQSRPTGIPGSSFATPGPGSGNLMEDSLASQWGACLVLSNCVLLTFISRLVIVRL